MAVGVQAFAHEGGGITNNGGKKMKTIEIFVGRRREKWTEKKKAGGRLYGYDVRNGNERIISLFYNRIRIYERKLPLYNLTLCAYSTIYWSISLKIPLSKPHLTVIINVTPNLL